MAFPLYIAMVISAPTPPTTSVTASKGFVSCDLSMKSCDEGRRCLLMGRCISMVSDDILSIVLATGSPNTTIPIEIKK